MELSAFSKPKNSSAIIPTLGLVAQSVEQRIENPCVGGSIPPRATKNYDSPLVGLFSFMAWRGKAPLVSRHQKRLTKLRAIAGAVL
jgi:hypothetical protein